MTKEYDLAEVLKGNIESVREKFGDLSDDNLVELHGLEGKGANRTTLLDAIDHETKARTTPLFTQQQADRMMAEAVAKASDAAGDRFTQADIDAQLAARDAEHAKAIEGMVSRDDHEGALRSERNGLFTQDDVDGLLARQKLTHESDKKLALENAMKDRKERAASPKKDKPITLATTGDGPGLTALTGATQVVFVDDEDVPVKSVPGLTFAADDFQPAGRAVVLNREVDFPQGLPAGEVAGAFLMRGDSAVGKATLVQKLSIGGGMKMTMPKGTLSFAGRDETSSSAAIAG